MLECLDLSHDKLLENCSQHKNAATISTEGPESRECNTWNWTILSNLARKKITH
eukprot:COSAG01_NODE_5121_length_4471_cov_8.084629_1_plen_53_part_10